MSSTSFQRQEYRAIEAGAVWCYTQAIIDGAGGGNGTEEGEHVRKRSIHTSYIITSGSGSSSSSIVIVIIIITIRIRGRRVVLVVLVAIVVITANDDNSHIYHRYSFMLIGLLSRPALCNAGFIRTFVALVVTTNNVVIVAVQVVLLVSSSSFSQSSSFLFFPRENELSCVRQEVLSLKNKLEASTKECKTLASTITTLQESSNDKV